MGGIIFPDGYSYLTDTVYSNNDKLVKSLKDGKDYVKVTIVDSRGNTSSSIKPLNVEIFHTPYFTNIDNTRLNDVDEKVELKTTGKLTYLGKYDVSYIKYWSSETPYNEYGESNGVEYGPFNIDISKIQYNQNKSEFSLKTSIEGDLGAEGFTKGKKFYIKLAIATSINLTLPEYFYTTVEDGKYIIVFGPDGMEIADTEKIYSDTLPIGFEGYYPSDTPPSNWLIEDGRAVSRSEYKELFDLIGIKFGEGDGSTTFNLPNKKGRVIVGYDNSQTEFNALGKMGGTKSVNVKHRHTAEDLRAMIGSSRGRADRLNYVATDPIDPNSGQSRNGTYTVFGTGNASDETFSHWTPVVGYTNQNTVDISQLQPYIVEYSIIKAKNMVPIKSTVIDDFNSNSTTDALSANKGRELYSIAKNKIVASFPIFGIAGDTPVNIDKGSWKDLGNVFYNFKSDIDLKIPLPKEYSRYAQMKLVYTDNCQLDNVATVVGLFDQNNVYKNISFNFEKVWGTPTNARVIRFSTNKVAWNIIPEANTVFKAIIHSLQQDGGAGQIRYAEMQIIDMKN